MVGGEHACDRERRAERGGQAEPSRVEGAKGEEERHLLAVFVAQLVELVRLVPSMAGEVG